MHWTLTIEERGIGWLNDTFHLRWRELMLHTLVRYDVVCPVYCLMPDHVHLVWNGTTDSSEQRDAMKFLRTSISGLLKPHSWQRQSYDHVLLENERAKNAFMAVCFYVLENPVRKGLVGQWQSYPFSGAMVPGYPTLDPRRDNFWGVFWRLHNGQVNL
ncbi:MAG: hypothetical protein ABIO94_08685 [Opitutaceae bacterium]